jgi:hypothetical protein
MWVIESFTGRTRSKYLSETDAKKKMQDLIKEYNSAIQNEIDGK